MKWDKIWLICNLYDFGKIGLIDYDIFSESFFSRFKNSHVALSNLKFKLFDMDIMRFQVNMAWIIMPHYHTTPFFLKKNFKPWSHKL
jgi:hypothetical protein